MKRRKPKARKSRQTRLDIEKLEKGVVHEIVQPMKVFVWACPRPKCIRNNWSERFQATVEAFLMVQVNRHVEMHKRQDGTAKRLSDMVENVNHSKDQAPEETGHRKRND